MIIGSAIKTLLDDLTIVVDDSNIRIMYEYGNQYALDNFISVMDSAGAQKLPLVFYVTGKVSEFNGWKTCYTSLIIMNISNESALSELRTKESYVKVIEPIYQKLKTIFTQNSNIQLIGERSEKMSYDDRPNYGIVKGGIGSKSSTESVATAYVDARVIDFKIRIKTNCIK